MCPGTEFIHAGQPFKSKNPVTQYELRALHSCSGDNKKLQKQKLAQSTFRDALNSAGFKGLWRSPAIKGSSSSATLIFAPLKFQGLEQKQVGPAFLSTWRLFRGQSHPVRAPLVPVSSQFSSWSPEQLIASRLSVQWPICGRVYPYGKWLL